MQIIDTICGGTDGDADGGADGDASASGCGSNGWDDFGTAADPLLSPLDADSELLRRLPPVMIGAVMLDPLLDDSLAFARRLQGLGNQVRLRVFEDLSHGFLQFGMIHQPSADAAKECVGWIKEVVNGGLELS
jgi:acetyl esterase/lipase